MRLEHRAYRRIAFVIAKVVPACRAGTGVANQSELLFGAVQGKSATLNYRDPGVTALITSEEFFIPDPQSAFGNPQAAQFPLGKRELLTILFTNALRNRRRR